MAAYTKDPDSTLDYAVDWSAWLDGDTVDSFAAAIDVAPDDELEIDSDSETGGVHTIWLLGGTVGQRYRVRSRIVTTGGRTDDRSFTVTIRQR